MIEECRALRVWRVRMPCAPAGDWFADLEGTAVRHTRSRRPFRVSGTIGHLLSRVDVDRPKGLEVAV